MSQELDRQLYEAVSHGTHHNPHSLLGAHPVAGGYQIRVLRPLAERVFVKVADQSIQLEHRYRGIWEGFINSDATPDYRIISSYQGVAEPWIADDPYRQLPTIGEMDLYLISEGRHERLWEVLGSRVVRAENGFGEASGTAFSVWAPGAKAVRVVGDFNHWDGTAHAMRNMGSSGVWELMIPEIAAGAKYKYEILTQDNQWLTKIDPMARSFEEPPKTASIVSESAFNWSDQSWLANRQKSDPYSKPLSIYELHLGSWKKGLGYRDLADELIGYLDQLGFSHVEFMPLAEHPFGGSWGYQVTGYYAPTARYGSPDDFKYLVNRLHQAGYGVILDWVPAHFPKDDWALAKFDGSSLYEHEDPRRGEHPDWGTYIFDFGRKEVRNFLVANALYWLEEFHIDGLRVDAVASMLYLDYSRQPDQWLPNASGGRENLDAIAFLQEVNATCYKHHPGIMMIAEESTSWPGVSNPTDGGGLGFGFKWNMGWMHDSLQYIEKDAIYRSYHHQELTFSMLYAYNEKFVLPISHDEVVHGKGSLLSKMPGDRWQQFANVRAYLSFMWSHPGKKLLFMGSEFGQSAEWSESTGLDWAELEQPSHTKLQQFVATLNRVYLTHPALWELDHQPEGFEWIDGGNSEQNVLSFIRRDSSGNELVVVINFATHPYSDFRLGFPKPGTWQEILNSDSEIFFGSGVINQQVQAIEQPSHGQPFSAVITVPPLAGVWFARKATD